MRVEVEFTARARTMLVRWLARRMPNPDDAYPLAVVYVEAATGVMMSSQGRPDGAVKRTRGDGAEWWWQYLNGVWWVYTLTDSKRWFRPTVRRVRVFACVPSPPRPAA